jgi:hypothetical protein
MLLMTRIAFRPSHYHCTKKGDNIAIKGSSPQHVVDTFCAFGLQIQEAETKTEPETYMDTTSQKIVTVVESMLQPLIFSITNMYRQE